MTDYWLQSALTNNSLVAELLLQAKHSSDSYSYSLHPHPPSSSTPPSTSIITILPPRWGHRKNRSKSTISAKNGKEPRGSPTTHLSWSGGAASTSDGYDDSCRPSDLSSVARSVKVNEGASTSSYNKSEKRKVHLPPHEQELTSMRVPLSKQIATCDNLKRIKINLDQNQINKTRVAVEHERQMKLPSLVARSALIPCRVEAETASPQKGFMLPDLNMTPSEEDQAMMMS